MEIWAILVGLTVTVLCFFFNKYFVKIYDYWRNKGVPSVEGALPFFGNTLSILSFRKDFITFGHEVYSAYSDRSMVGYFQNQKPHLMVRDPELVKKVLITSFTNFHKNFMSLDSELDPLLAKNPFFIAGEEWKKRRSYLSNALMSSKKLKFLCTTVANVCEKFTKYLEDNVNKSKGVYEVEAKDLFACFTGEVVADVGFGLEGEFFAEQSNPDSFKNSIQGLFDPTISNSIRFAMIFLAPALNKFLRFSFLPKRVDHFFMRVTSQIIAERRRDGIVRNDFLQHMLDSHTRKNGEVDEVDITASALSFFIDGFETSAVTLSLFAYQLAVNPNVQDKLRREVNDVLEKHGDVISYESLAAMTYMDQALDESMRLNPAVGLLAKRCNESCNLVGSDGIECLVEVGTDVVVPIEPLHRDPKYWENPEVYDPERFSAEYKKGRPKNVFLPFGEGPRICVGMRFATMQMKAAMATLLRCCVIEISSKTKIPLKFNHTPLKAVKGGLWIKLKRI